MEKNLTTGSIPKALISFSVPLILGAVLQQMYQMIDIIIAGNLIGDHAVAAIGATSSIPFFIVNMFNGLTMGACVRISNLYGFGAGSYKDIPKTMGSFAAFTAAASVGIAMAGYLFCGTILTLFNTPDEIFFASKQYLSIVFIGIPFQAFYSLFSSALRAIGNSRVSFYSVLIAAILNLTLDIVLIRVFDLGVLGVAVATTFAQAISCLFLAVVILKKHKVLHFKFARAHINCSALYPSIYIGVPIALQRSLTTCGGLLAQSVINSFGNDVITGITTAYRIDELSMLSVVNIGAAITTFTAQNRGAQKENRVRSGFFIGSFLAISAAAITTSFIISNCYSIIGLFGVSKQSADYAYSLLKTCSFFYPIYGLMNACIGFLHGSSHTRTTVIGNAAALVVRLIVLFSLDSVVGFFAIPYSEISCWCVAATIFLMRCLRRDILPPKTIETHPSLKTR